MAQGLLVLRGQQCSAISIVLLSHIHQLPAFHPNLAMLPRFQLTSQYRSLPRLLRSRALHRPHLDNLLPRSQLTSQSKLLPHPLLGRALHRLHLGDLIFYSLDSGHHLVEWVGQVIDDLCGGMVWV